MSTMTSSDRMLRLEPEGREGAQDVSQPAERDEFFTALMGLLEQSWAEDMAARQAEERARRLAATVRPPRARYNLD